MYEDLLSSTFKHNCSLLSPRSVRCLEGLLKIAPENIIVEAAVSSGVLPAMLPCDSAC